MVLDAGDDADGAHADRVAGRRGAHAQAEPELMRLRRRMLAAVVPRDDPAQVRRDQVLAQRGRPGDLRELPVGDGRFDHHQILRRRAHRVELQPAVHDRIGRAHAQHGRSRPAVRERLQVRPPAVANSRIDVVRVEQDRTAVNSRTGAARSGSKTSSPLPKWDGSVTLCDQTPR